jgi:hypothetical protein
LHDPHPYGAVRLHNCTCTGEHAFRSWWRSFGEQQEQGGDGVANHDQEKRYLPVQGGPAREQGEGAVAGQDDAKDVAHDNGGGLDAPDQTGIATISDSPYT